MPSFVASIEVYFDAESLADAAMFADALGDVIAEDAQAVRVSAITTGVAPDADA